jgi:ABC-type antimicrobial peptide transport system permease subunit
LTKIEGIQKITKLSIYHLQDFNDWGPASRSYMITIASIHNTTEFLEVVDSELFNHTKYTEADILELGTNMTYMMNTKYVRKNNFDKGANFSTGLFTQPGQVPYNMSYVNSMDVFPIMPISAFFGYSRWFEIFSLVTSELTAHQLLNRSSSTSYLSYNNYLLMKLEPGANVTQIKYDIISNFGLPTFSSDDYKVDIEASVSTFGLNYFTVASIITILIGIFYGFITARNIYNERLRIIESEYQIGAKKTQIWIGFTIELLLIIILPLALSFAATIPLLNSVSAPLLNIQEFYARFTPWLPWWLIFIIILLCYATLTGGWLLEMIPLVSKYRPIKQE